MQSVTQLALTDGSQTAIFHINGINYVNTLTAEACCSFVTQYAEISVTKHHSLCYGGLLIDSGMRGVSIE